MTVTPKIEKNIPIPPISANIKGRGPSIYADMEVGDSLFFPGTLSFKRATTSCFAHGKHHNKKFTTRSEGTGGRVWRIK